MAEAVVDDQHVDLLTCSVCFNSFDQDDHLPKFLSCHHTLCIECVQTIRKRAFITCPLCRSETVLTRREDLPTNPYIIHMLISFNKMDHSQHRQSIKKEKSFDLTTSFTTHVFAFTFSKYDEDIGAVIVKPSSRFYRPFILELGRRCLSTMDLGVDIKKACPSSFVILRYFDDSPITFCKNADPESSASFVDRVRDAENPMDVGISLTFSEESDVITHFQMEFILDPSRSKTRNFSYLFGEVIEGRETMEIMSKTTLVERRGFNVTIEYREL